MCSLQEKEYEKLKESNRHLVATVKGLTGAFLVVGVSVIFTFPFLRNNKSIITFLKSTIK